jgi:hypothetical protein
VALATSQYHFAVKREKWLGRASLTLGTLDRDRPIWIDDDARIIAPCLAGDIQRPLHQHFRYGGGAMPARGGLNAVGGLMNRQNRPV